MKNIILLTSLLLMVSCSETEPPIFGTLQGFVVEEGANTPIQGVTITLSPNGNSTVTGSDGRYEFAELTSQQYDVTASKSGFQPDTKTFMVTPGQTISGDFSLTKGVSSLLANPSYLDFGTTNSQMAFDITNLGSVSTNFTVTPPSGNWCTITPSKGTLQANNGTAGIVVSIVRANISTAKQENIIIQADNGGSQSVTIKVSLGDNPTDTDTQVTAGLWAYYTFDDENMNDSWENQMNGNFDYTPKFTSTTPNENGKSLMVGLNNSNQWVKARIPYNPFAGKTEYSYCFWVKNPTQGLLMNAYGNNTDSNTANYPTMRIADNKLYACFDSYSLSDFFDYNPSTVIQNGQWNHIAVSVKDGEQILYLNGVRTSTQQSDVYSSRSTEIHFGGSLYNIDGAEMTIDNIRIYTRTISQTDAMNIYNSEK